MKNLKWTANELLDSFNRECNQGEMNELYKALIAYSCGMTEITTQVDKVLDDVIENDYFENDNVSGIINEEVIEKAVVKLDEFFK